MKSLRFMKAGPLAIAASALGEVFDLSEPKALSESDGIAVVEICGPLVHHQAGFWDNYEAIEARVSAALASNCKAVVLRIDSPGGDVSGCFEVSRALRGMAAVAEKPLIAYVAGQASSAAYAIACACSAIHLPATSSVGSIGVINALADQTAMDREAGVNFAVVASGARKTDGNPHVAISEGAVAECQSQVDYLAELFFDLVAESRGISKDAVRSLEAASFIGAKAVERKLADGVCTLSELLAMLASGVETKAVMGAAAEVEMDKEEMRAALKKMADGEGADAAWAKKMVSEDVDEKDEEKKDEEKKDDDKKEEAKAEDPKDEPKTEDDDKKDEAKALVSKALSRIETFERRQAKREEDEERGRLLASRPDFPVEVVGSMTKAPISVVRDAVKAFPKFSKPSQNMAAIAGALQAGAPTTGGQVSGSVVTNLSGRGAELDAKMGLRASKEFVIRDRNELSIKLMTPAEAREHVKKLEARNTSAVGGK